MTVYVFLSREKQGHIHLDSGKSANNNETLDLTEAEQQKDLIKQFIKNGVDGDETKDRLVPLTPISQGQPIEPKTPEPEAEKKNKNKQTRRKKK